MSKEKLNPFDQYLKWLNDNTLGGNLLQIAYRAHIRQRKDLPEGVRNLLGGTSEANAGLLYKVFKLMSQMEGSIELAYRRGYQAGMEDANSPEPQKTK